VVKDSIWKKGEKRGKHGIDVFFTFGLEGFKNVPINVIFYFKKNFFQENFHVLMLLIQIKMVKRYADIHIVSFKMLSFFSNKPKSGFLKKNSIFQIKFSISN